MQKYIFKYQVYTNVYTRVYTSQNYRGGLAFAASCSVHNAKG